MLALWRFVIEIHDRLSLQVEAGWEISEHDLEWVEGAIAARAGRCEPPWIVAEGALGFGIAKRHDCAALEALFDAFRRAHERGEPIAIRYVGGGSGNGRRYPPSVAVLRKSLVAAATRALRLKRAGSIDDVRPAVRAAVHLGYVQLPDTFATPDARTHFAANVRASTLLDLAEVAWLFCLARSPLLAPPTVGAWEHGSDGRPADWDGWVNFVATLLLDEDVQRLANNDERASGKLDARQGPRVAAQAFVARLTGGIDSLPVSHTAEGSTHRQRLKATTGS